MFQVSLLENNLLNSYFSRLVFQRKKIKNITNFFRLLFICHDFLIVPEEFFSFLFWPPFVMFGLWIFCFPSDRLGVCCFTLTKCNVNPGLSYFELCALAHLHFAFCQSKATLPSIIKLFNGGLQS